MSNTSASGTTFGQNNTFVGNQAGMNSNSSAGNTFIGAQAGLVSGMLNGSSICCNTFLGNGAGAASSVSNNTLLGYRAGGYVTGSDNTFIGQKAGLGVSGKSSGGNNIFIGVAAGQANLGGNWNTFIGVASGLKNTTGNYNMYIGPYSGFNVLASNSNNIEIDNVGVSTDNGYIRIGCISSSTCTVGSSPQTAAYIAGVVHQPTVNTIVNWNTTTGQLGYTTITSGGVNGSCTSPSGGLWLTLWAAGTPSTTVECSNQIFQQNTTNFIGIGNQNPSTALEVGGPSATKGSGEITADFRYDIYDNQTSLAESILSIGNSNPTDRNLNNLFVGLYAGGSPSNSGEDNTFVGYGAGSGNVAAGSNTCVGREACAGETSLSSSGNSFFGAGAGQNNNGSNNTCMGEGSCTAISTASYDIAVGVNAGSASTGNSNIYLGNTGVGGEANAIRIGTQGSGNGLQNATYIAGIYQEATSGTNNLFVCVDTNGKLGTTNCETPSMSPAEQEASGQQQQQIQAQAQQIASLQQRLALLESLISKKTQ